MTKKIVLFSAVVVLTLHTAPFANGQLRIDGSILRSYSVSNETSPSRPGPFCRYIASASSRSPGKTTTKARPMPTAPQRRDEVRVSIQHLIAFSRKSSADIRREVKKLKSQKNKRINAAEIKLALDMADQYDRYAQRLQQKGKTLTNNQRDLDRTYQTMSDMSQQLQLQLQDAMNKQQQAMQILSNIMKNQHDTLKSIIQNMK